MPKSCSFIASSITSNLPGSQLGFQKAKLPEKSTVHLSNRCNLQLFKLILFLFILSGSIDIKKKEVNSAAGAGANRKVLRSS
jgi:hypothetical protein